MNCRTTLLLVIATLFAVPCVALAEGDAVQGQQKAETCLGCHAVVGYFTVYPSYRVPKLGRQSAKYIASALKPYQQGLRPHPTMRANASGLTDEDIADIAAFVESFGQ